MARDPDVIEATLGPLLNPDARERLLAKGLARGMIWRGGKIPPEGPNFPDDLTDDLLHFGYGILALALELRDANLARQDKRYETSDGFRVAAECIESAVRRGDASDMFRGLHLVVAAAAFHLAGFAARSYTLLPSPEPGLNLSSAETALGLLLRRELRRLRTHIIEWLADSEHTDETVALRLVSEDDDFGPEDAIVVALSAMYHRALGLADTALYLGDGATCATALQLLGEMVNGAAQAGNIPLWWVGTLSRHLVRDVWDQSLHVCLPSGPRPGLPELWSDQRRDLIQSLAVSFRPQVDLWPSQLEAARRAIDPTDDLIVSLPTSSGKTRIAELCILRTLADERRVVYVTPLRALSAQLEKTLAQTFTPLGISVTSLYGSSGITLTDTNTLETAEIVVATPEKLDFAIRQDPRVLDDVGLLVFDEGHMIGLGSREIRYEVLIQRLLRRGDAGDRRIVCLSAMFNTEDEAFQDFTQWLRSDEPGDSIHVNWRPTRQRTAFLDWKGSVALLQFREGEKPFVPRFIEARSAQESSVRSRRNNFPQNEKEFCIAAANAFAKDGHNVLVYSPVRSSVESLVKEFAKMSRQGYIDGVAAPHEDKLTIALAVGREWLGANHPAVTGLKIGIGTHHAALPRPFLAVVEDLLNQKLLPIVVASPTLAQGIDLACSTLIFRSITRFNPRTGKQEPIEAAEFANVVGRAGRAYVDIDGITVYPSYEKHRYRHGQFKKLASKARSQTLWSGLARLVKQIATIIGDRLGVQRSLFLDYVLNQRDFWSDDRLRAAGVEDEDEEMIERSLEDYLADLDVALLSLIEPLDTPENELASLLDFILLDSLWKRTISRFPESFQEMERTLLISRARWLWRVTDVKQRSACFSAGLGRQSGVFLYDNIDSLADMLVRFQKACNMVDIDEVSGVAVEIADFVMRDRFFSMRKLPSNWKKVLEQWVKGVAFSEILVGRPSSDRSKVQAFIQEGVVFKLVWAVEAVRVQAQSVDHPLAEELGDGAALVLAYGVPSIEAALLCQRGFASRTGAVWATSQLPRRFSDFDGLLSWILDNHEQLSDPDFWESRDQHLLWSAQPSGGGARIEEWGRRVLRVPVRWLNSRPSPKARLRLAPRVGREVSICSESLELLGEATLDFDPKNTFLTGLATPEGLLELEAFGPA